MRRWRPACSFGIADGAAAFSISSSLCLKHTESSYLGRGRGRLVTVHPRQTKQGNSQHVVVVFQTDHKAPMLPIHADVERHPGARTRARSGVNAQGGEK